MMASSNISPMDDAMERPVAGGYEFDLDRFIAQCQRMLGAPPELRRRIEDAGVMLAPANYCSSVPLLAELETTFEGAEGSRLPAYYRVFNHAAITRSLAGMAEFADEFDPPIAGDEENCTGYYWDNIHFSHGDAMAYYCLVRQLQPRRIVEIGSGFSTLVADAAMRKNGGGEIVCIEPSPRPFLPRIASVARIINQPIQSLAPHTFGQLLEPDDILFIDSTHTVKIGSDCLYIYLVLLPSLTERLTVHSHDIFLPFGMPLNWARDLQFYWTEQYLLYAYLLDNPRARVIFGSAYAYEFLRDASEHLMRGRYTAGGGSLWYEINAPQQAPSRSALASLARRFSRGLRGIGNVASYKQSHPRDNLARRHAILRRPHPDKVPRQPYRAAERSPWPPTRTASS